jgi:N-glycosylase/DNA lyase
MDQDFLRDVQKFVANAFSISTIRNMGPPGTLRCVRNYLRTIDLRTISRKDTSKYSEVLDELTESLRRALPRQARKWGIARKCLNLFFRDALYNFYLRKAFGLAKFETQLEIPLDSNVGKGLRKEDQNLPRWHSVKALTPELSAKFQAVASKIAKRNNTHRVHLDVIYWRGDLDEHHNA